MSIDVIIRGYRPDDYDACRALWAELTEWHRRIYGDPDIGGPDPGAHFAPHLAKVGGDNLWVAVHEDAVIGLTGLMGEGDEAEVEPAVVSEPYRGRGVGRMLMETVIAEARDRGVKFLSVRPVARNVEAIRFFVDRGFTNVGHIELFIDFTDRQWREGLDLTNLKLKY
ncbi:MAG: GNAT family N-acetyltransferase [Candidatus Bathyarchaeota archaeon]|jgi:GNAT superfamily N-acetyltransferase